MLALALPVLGLALSCATTEPAAPEGPSAIIEEAINPTQRVDLDRVLGDEGSRNPLPDRVVLIAVEGLTPDVYESSPGGRLRPVDATLAPNLARLAKSGIYADAMKPVVPSMRMPAHATLVSGRRANRHGIVSDHLLGDNGVRGARLTAAFRLVGETLWQRAADVEMPVVSIGWPTTVGANIANLVPSVDPAYPGQTWYSALDGVTSPALLRIAREIDAGRSAEGWPSAEIEDDVVTGTACALIQSEAPMGLWFLSLGQYAEALAAAGAGSAFADAALERVDGQIGRLLSCFARAGGLRETTFIVVGDRSLRPVHTDLRPNAVLSEIGLLTPPIRTANTQVTSWSVIVRSNGSSAFVYARDEASAVLARKTLDRAGRRSGLFRVISARELADLHGDPQAWFGLEAEPGYRLGNRVEGALIGASARMADGGSLPERDGSAVGFVAWGAGLRSGVRVPFLRQIDVAPTISELLGLQLRDADGQALIGVILPPVLKRPLARPPTPRVDRAEDRN